MSAQPNVPNSGEREQKRRLKSVGSKVTKAPTRVASVASEASRVTYRHTSKMVRDIKKADLRFHTKPAEFAQAITASAQGTISDVAGTAATQIGRATNTAADKTADIARTTVTRIGRATDTVAGKTADIARTTAAEIGDAMGIAADRLVEHNRAFREKCRKSFESLNIDAPKVREDAQERAKTAAAAAWGALLNVQTAVPDFGDLPTVLKAKFAMAGTHGIWRPVDVAGAFYESGIPLPIRNLGADAVLAFVDGKHASHIEAVVNAPGRMMDAANIVWEAAHDNLARGGADMTPLELAKINALNVLDSTGIVAAEALQTAAVAGGIGMALEGVVSVSENLIYVYKDEMMYRQASRNVLKDVLKKGKGAAIGGAGMTVVAALGAGPALATAAPVLVTVGGVVYAVSAYKRIKTALDSTEEVPSLVPPVPSSPALGTA